MSGNSNKIKLALAGGLLFTVTSISAQTVKGTVTDNTGEPIIGASVMEVGVSGNGSATDLDGNFTLSLKGKSNKVKISYIGMKPKTLSVAGKQTITVKLEDEANDLNDVVVIGYTTVRKKDLTGAVTQVGAKQIENVPVTNVTEALTGKMAGVNITTTEGSPDADIKIRVRGGGSLSQDNSPLYIVDGFEVNSISDIAASEIETVDVLKDAASTAIYGARGANGVVIITTKSGKEGKVQVNLNASTGWRKMTKEIDVMDPYNFALYQYEVSSASQSNATTSSYGSYADLDLLKAMQGRNYQNEVFGRTGTQTTYDVSVNGGSKDVKFNVSYAHTGTNAIMLGSDYKRDNISAKLNANINKWLSLDFKASLANEKTNGLGSGADTNESNAANSIVANTIKFQPISTITSDGEEDEENNTSTRVDPTTRINNTYKQKRSFTQTYNAGLTWKPWKGLKFSSKLQYQWKNVDTDQVWLAPAATNSKYGYSGRPQALLITDDKKTIINTNTVQYDKKKLFCSDDKFTILVGQEWKETKETDREMMSANFDKTWTVDGILSNMSAGTTIPNYSYVYPEDRLVSFFGQVLYTLKDKYLLNATLRTDGSSKFGKGNKWGVFPAVAVAWRMSDENFLRDVKWLSNLKTRLSFGTAGNNRISSGLTSVQYKMGGNTGAAAYFDESRAPYLETSGYLYNPNLKWETTITRNFGIDYGFFRGRLSGSVDLYWNTTKDLLMKARVQSSAGYLYQYQNFGQTSNKGVEFSANIVAVDKKTHTMNVNLNIAYNKNKIDKLTSDDPWQSSSFAGSTFGEYNDYYITEGGALGEVWGYKMNGYYTVYDPATGQGDLVLQGTKWVLRDGNNSKSYTKTGSNLYPGGPKFEEDEDGNPVKQRLGNTVPTVTGGFGLDGQVRTKIGTFDYNAFFNYSLGNKIMNGTKAANAFYSGSSAGYNLVGDFNIENRYSWVDPQTGLNLGRPSDNIVSYYGGADGLMKRLNEINAGKSMYNPAAASTMVITDYALENADFLRLQNVTIGYSLPKQWIKKIYLENVRIYFTGYNLFCLTSYSGYDPEVDVSKNAMCPGIDYAAYPKSRSFVMGINVGF